MKNDLITPRRFSILANIVRCCRTELALLCNFSGRLPFSKQRILGNCETR